MNNKVVIFKDYYKGFCVTSLENFKSTILDKNKVIQLLDCYNILDCKNVVKQYLKVNDDDIIIHNNFFIDE